MVIITKAHLTFLNRTKLLKKELLGLTQEMLNAKMSVSQVIELVK